MWKLLPNRSERKWRRIFHHSCGILKAQLQNMRQPRPTSEKSSARQMLIQSMRKRRTEWQMATFANSLQLHGLRFTLASRSGQRGASKDGGQSKEATEKAAADKEAAEKPKTVQETVAKLEEEKRRVQENYNGLQAEVEQKQLVFLQEKHSLQQQVQKAQAAAQQTVAAQQTEGAFFDGDLSMREGRRCSHVAAAKVHHLRGGGSGRRERPCGQY
eukprot:symbB.v1.2.038682.t1/scaffold6120.1/size20769/1